jgi:hypothetical protein
MNVNIGTDPNYTLQELELFINQKERFFRWSLVDLGNDDTQTVIELDQNQPPPPDKFITLKPTIGEATATISGYNLVCTGICFIVGQRQKIAAYRPT